MCSCMLNKYISFTVVHQLKNCSLNEPDNVDWGVQLLPHTHHQDWFKIFHIKVCSCLSNKLFLHTIFSFF